MSALGLPTECADPVRHSRVPADGVTLKEVDADALRLVIQRRFDLSPGTGQGEVNGQRFRSGHLGDCNDLRVLATLDGVETGLGLVGFTMAGCGVRAAMDYLAPAGCG